MRLAFFSAFPADSGYLYIMFPYLKAHRLQITLQVMQRTAWKLIHTVTVFTDQIVLMCIAAFPDLIKYLIVIQIELIYQPLFLQHIHITVHRGFCQCRKLLF